MNSKEFHSLSKEHQLALLQNEGYTERLSWFPDMLAFIEYTKENPQRFELHTILFNLKLIHHLSLRFPLKFNKNLTAKRNFSIEFASSDRNTFDSIVEHYAKEIAVNFQILEFKELYVAVPPYNGTHKNYYEATYEFVDNRKLTLEEERMNAYTWRHIWHVQKNLHQVIKELLRRIESHDQSKLQLPEVQYFTKENTNLRNSTYGSQEYIDVSTRIIPALEHHYQFNRHHPEYFENGIQGMNLIDLIEMLCDWKAATLRQADGDIFKSLEINKAQRNISEELYQILKNTINWIEEQRSFE